MTMRSKRGRGLILGAVNVAVVLGAALIIQSQASSDVAPGYSSASFSIPDEPELAFTNSSTPRTAVASASAPVVKPTAASDHAASVAGPSISSTDSPETERESILDEIWYSAPSSAYAAFPSFEDESSEWPGLGGSPVTSWGNPQPTWAGSSSRGRYAGGFGGGGSSPGGMGGQSGSRSGSTAPVATAAALRGSADGPTATTAGSHAFQAMQANANLPQGNPFSGLNTQTGFAFPVMQFPGNGPGGSGPPVFGASNLTTQSTVTTLQTPVSVPEPGSVLLLSTGVALAAAYRSRRRSKK